jgi:SAM-dependent methyltransferase
VDHITPNDSECSSKDADRWDYEQDDYEQARYEATLEACGDGPFANVLELGGSLGIFTEMLTPRCQALSTIDVSRTAAAMARRRLAEFPRVRVIRGAIPDAVPDEEFDLIVASEILYHLTTDELDRTLRMVRARLVSGGRLIVVHWRPPGPERRFGAAELHARLREDPWLTPILADESEIYLLDALERR